MIIAYEEITQGSDEWFKIRCGHPTASEFSKLVTPARMEPSKQVYDYAIQLAADKWAGEPVDHWNGNDWTERGHELEPEARAWYEMQTNTDVTQVGFIENTMLEAGCSPDGLIEDEGLFETKNCGLKQHIRCLAKPECPRDYMAQLQGQLLITERSWVDLLLHHPQLPKKIIRVTPIQKFQDLLKAQIELVLKERDRFYQIIEDSA